jgi:O-antigen/teichoic acid export membrane protein
MKGSSEALAFVRRAYDKGFFHLLSTNFLTQALGFGTLLVLAKIFTPEEVGLLKILQSYGGVFTLLAGFGINTAVLRYCAIPESNDERQAIFRGGLRLAYLIAALAWTLFVLLSLSGFRSSSGDARKWFLLYSLVIPFMGLTTLFSAYLHANKLMKIMANLQGGFRALTFLLVLGIGYFVGFGGFVVGSVIGGALLLFAHVRQVSRLMPLRGSHVMPSGFVAMAAWSLAANGIGMLGGYADVFLLDRYMPDRAQIGYYSVATFFMLAAMQVTGAIQAIATPYFAEKTHDRVWTRKYLLRIQTLTMLCSVPVALSTFGAAWILVNYYYDASYSRVLDVLPFLLVRYFIHASHAVIGIALLTARRVDINFMAATLSAFANFIAGYVLLPRFGLDGVAMGQLVGPLLSLLVTIAAARYVFGGDSLSNRSQPEG